MGCSCCGYSFLAVSFRVVLIYVSGSYYLYTEETALFAIKKHLPLGKLIAIAIIVTVGIGQWNSLIGILGITSNVVFEILALNFPSLLGHKYEVVLALAVLIIGVFYFLLVKGNYSLFEKVLCFVCFYDGPVFYFHPLFCLPYAYTSY